VIKPVKHESASFYGDFNLVGREKSAMKFKLPTKSTYFKTEKLSALQIFQKMFGVGNFVGKLIGTNIIDSDFTVKNPLFALLIVDMITYLAINFQNIYAFRENFEKVVFCVVTLGMGFQGAAKLYSFIWHREKILKLKAMAESFHESSMDVKAQLSFEKWALICCHIGCFVVLVFNAIAVLVFLYPIIVYLIFGLRILHFGFVIPGIDSERTFGYCINFAHQALQIYIVINAVIESCVSKNLFICSYDFKLSSF
jgi:hypothetical protein